MLAQLGVDPCGGGAFERIRIDYKKAEFLIAARSPQFYDSIYPVKNKTITEDILNKQKYAEEQINSVIPKMGANNFSLYPNPTSGLIKINIPENMNQISIEITSYTGQTIYTCELTNESIIELDLSAHSPGVYFVNIRTDKTENRIKVVKY